MKPRVLFVGRTRYRLPLDPAQERKWNALADQFEIRVIGTAAGRSDQGGVASPHIATDGDATPPQATPGDATPRHATPPSCAPRFELIPDSLGLLGFYASLSRRITTELRQFRPDVIVAQSPYEAAAALAARRRSRSEAKLLLEVHGDWGTATRLYGSPLRRLIGPLSRRVARLAVGRADAVRTVSPFTSGLVRALSVEPTATFTTYYDVSAFLDRAPVKLPEQPRALFVGVLERYKNVAGLAEAWHATAARVPEARLRVIGRGRERAVVERLVAESGGRVEWTEFLPADGIAAALDDASVLVLPSFSEGLPRVVMEAFARARPVVGSRAGGISDIVEDGVNGVLVPPGDAAALADALVSVLTDREFVARLARGARDSAERWIQTPEQYAARFRELVDRMLA